MSKTSPETAAAEIVQPANVVEALHLDIATIERACEVQRITVKQALKRMHEKAQEVHNTAKTVRDRAENAFTKNLEVAVLAHYTKLPETEALAAAFRKLMGVRITAAQLVSGVEFIDRAHDTLIRFRGGQVMEAVSSDNRLAYVQPEFYAACWPVTNKNVEEEDTDLEDAQGRRRCQMRWFKEDFVLNAELQKEAATVRRLDGHAQAAWNNVARIAERLEKAAEIAEELKGAILRKQIEQSAGGTEILKLLDRSTNATIHGKYLALL